MDFETFRALSTEQIADIVRHDGPRVVVFPINGTRRWFLLEGPPDPAAFLDRILERYISLFDSLFAHGIHTLLTPILGPDIAARGEDYLAMVGAALHEITGGRRFLDFYKRLDVRVGFYGDYRPFLEEHFPAIPGRIEHVRAVTQPAEHHRLFWGMFAHDPVAAAARTALALQRAQGAAPDREAIVAAYYGEPVAPADLFIGMLPPRVFDFPLLDTGSTALYFTRAPSPYLDDALLCRILFDFLYNRPADDGYDNLSAEDRDALRVLYTSDAGRLVGAGRLAADGRIWIPD